MKIPKLKTLFSILALCALIAGHSVYKLNSAPKVPTKENMLGQTRPEFKLYDINGKLRDINEWQGQVVVLNFWGTWCPPCLKEIPDLQAFHKLNYENVVLIGIAHDKVDKVLEFNQTTPIDYLQLVDPKLTVELSRLYGNERGTLPYTVIIDKKGIIRHIHSKGVVTTAELKALVEPLR